MVASTFHVGIGPSNKIKYVSYVPGGSPSQFGDGGIHFSCLDRS